MRPPDGPLLDRHDPLAVGASSSSTSRTLPAPSWSRATGSGAPAVGVGHRAGRALLRGVPVAEGEVVEAAGRDLLGGEDDLVAIRLARDRRASRGPSRRATCRAGVAVDASNPASGLVGARFVAKTRPWTTASQGGEVDARAGPGSGPSRGRRRRLLPASAAGRRRDRSTSGRRRRGCRG